MSGKTLSLFRADRITFEVPHGAKEDVIEQLLGVTLTGLEATDEARGRLLALLHARESKGSTGVGQIAFPHSRSGDLTEPILGAAVFPDGLDFKAVDGNLVHCVFMLLSPEGDAAAHVQLLRDIAGIARHPDFPRFIRQTKKPEDVVSLLRELGPS